MSTPRESHGDSRTSEHSEGDRSTLQTRRTSASAVNTTADSIYMTQLRPHCTILHPLASPSRTSGSSAAALARAAVPRDGRSVRKAKGARHNYADAKIRLETGGAMHSSPARAPLLTSPLGFPPRPALPRAQYLYLLLFIEFVSVLFVVHVRRRGCSCPF